MKMKMQQKVIKLHLIIPQQLTEINLMAAKKGCSTELAKIFLKGFDDQLLGVKNDKKLLNATLPANHLKKLANKKTKFECKILKVKKPKALKIDDTVNTGVKDIKDLKSLIEKQISSQYSQTLNSITKKKFWIKLKKPSSRFTQNLIDQEILIMTQNLKPEEKEKHKSNNEKLAKSRIKLGLLLNEYKRKNNLKVSDDEVKNEIQKQIKGMHQEK